MDTKSKNSKIVKDRKKRRRPGLIVVWILVLAATAAFLSQYGHFKEQASVEQPDLLFDSEFFHEIYQANTVLYWMLQPRKGGGNVSGADLFLQAEEETVTPADAAAYYDFEEDTPLSYAGEQLDDLLSDWYVDFQNDVAAYADYQIVDTESGEMETNTDHDLQTLGTEEAGTLADYYAYYIRLFFDEDGLLEHAWVRGENADTLLENVQRVMKSRYLERCLYENLSYSAYGKAGWEDEIYYGTEGNVKKMQMTVLNTPRSCMICYAFTPEQMTALRASSYPYQSALSTENYLNSGIQQTFYMLLLVLGIAALLLPLWKGYHLHEEKLLPLHIEVLVLVLFATFLLLGELAANCVMFTMSDRWDHSLSYMLCASLPFLSEEIAAGIVLCINLLILIMAFFLWFTLVTALCQVYIFGINGYIRKRCLCSRLFRTLRVVKKRKSIRLTRELWQADLEQSRDNVLLKIVVANFLLLSLFSLLWVFGTFLLVPYSFLLYALLRKYIHGIQADYAQVVTAAQTLAAGDLHTPLTGDFGMFASLKGELSEIQTGFSQAVEEEVKSQRMRTELITNVSHDLKTPLTAIITYISLLQEKGVTEAQQKEYLNVLERKSFRLKVLIEDLFELSKANSGSVTVHLEKMDVCHLLRQVYLEHEDKAQAADLAFRFELPEEKVFLLLDGEKAYRIFDNLYTNIIKYAMPHTRVYVRVRRQNGEVEIEMKNISGTELNVSPEKLTERFVRGDSSRSTEGSGLGLAIAKTLVELQEGRMEIAVDGDLFKVTLLWKS